MDNFFLAKNSHKLMDIGLLYGHDSPIFNGFTNR